MRPKMLFPQNMAELSVSLAQMTEYSRIIAGGTDIIPAMHDGRIHPDLLVDISNIYETTEIRELDDSVLVGASVCFSILAESQLINNHFPAVAKAASCIGSKQIRNRGTIGGNIANASPAGDMLPPLLALDTDLFVFNKNKKFSTRKVQDILERGLITGEVITAVRIPLQPDNRYNCFSKLGSRNAVSISKLNIAINASYSHKDGLVTDPVIYIGAIGKVPLRASCAENTLNNNPLSAEALLRFAEALSKDVSNAIPARKSLPYKKEAVKGLADDIMLQFSKLTE